MLVYCDSPQCNWKGTIYDLHLDERGRYKCPSPKCVSMRFQLKAHFWCKECGWEGLEPQVTRMGGYIHRQCVYCGNNVLEVD